MNIHCLCTTSGAGTGKEVRNSSATDCLQTLIYEIMTIKDNIQLGLTKQYLNQNITISVI